MLASYLAPQKDVKMPQMPEAVIYPFGLNQSQKLAVERALSSKISIIQGPPGTGKTQTIQHHRNGLRVVFHHDSLIGREREIDSIGCLGDFRDETLPVGTYGGTCLTDDETHR